MIECWETVLKKLQKARLGLTEEEVQNLVGDEYAPDIIEEIRKKGYEVLEIVGGITGRYNLTRFYSQDRMHFRPMAELEGKIAICSDTHFTSTGHSILAWDQFCKECIERDVTAVLHAGDVIQGLGVHRVELIDLTTDKIDEQERFAIRELKKLQGIPIHLVIGNHEEKILGRHQVGHDPVKAIAKEVPNCNYYGWGFNALINDLQLFMEHTSGGITYAQSYKPQRIYDNLTEKPDLFITGHLHQLGVWYKPFGHYLIQAGCFQRQNSYLAYKGYTPSVGWIFLDEFSKEKCKWEIRTPKVY